MYDVKTMPPNLDIYGYTMHRDAAYIDKFIDSYVDRAKSEDRGDEELAILPLDCLTESLSYESCDYEPTLTLTHIIELGLQYPCRAFRVYLTSKNKDLSGSTLSFTTDNQLVLGLSIDDEGQKEENEAFARALLEQLRVQFDCHAGLILVETPPPLSESDFKETQKGPFTVFSFVKDG